MSFLEFGSNCFLLFLLPAGIIIMYCTIKGISNQESQEKELAGADLEGDGPLDSHPPFTSSATFLRKCLDQPPGLLITLSRPFVHV